MGKSELRRCGAGLAAMLVAGSVEAAEINLSPAPLIRELRRCGAGLAAMLVAGSVEAAEINLSLAPLIPIRLTQIGWRAVAEEMALRGAAMGEIFTLIEQAGANVIYVASGGRDGKLGIDLKEVVESTVFAAGLGGALGALGGRVAESDVREALRAAFRWLANKVDQSYTGRQATSNSTSVALTREVPAIIEGATEISYNGLKFCETPKRGTLAFSEAEAWYAQQVKNLADWLAKSPVQSLEERLLATYQLRAQLREGAKKSLLTLERAEEFLAKHPLPSLDRLGAELRGKYSGEALKEAKLRELQSPDNPCFVAGTLVRTKDGLKPIEEIRVGDWVLSYPDNQAPPSRFRTDAEYTYRRVTQTFVHEDKAVCKVTVFHFGSNSAEDLMVTPNHPFYVDEEGWVPASGLNFTCPLEAHDFGNLAVGGVESIAEKARVYNLEVEEFHTYYVGRLGVWVHNACGEVTRLPPLRDIKTEEPISIYTKEAWKNSADPGAPDLKAITGDIGELYAKAAIEAKTGMKFLSDEMRNGGRNNGPDLWNLTEPLGPGQKAQLTVLDAKGSTVPGFPSPAKEKLVARTKEWINLVHDTGKINGVEITGVGRQQYERAWQLLQEENLEITTGLVYVKIPKAGTVGTLEVLYRGNPNMYQETGTASAVAPAAPLSNENITYILQSARQYWLDAGVPAARLAQTTVQIGNLPQGIVGATQGTQITLSPDAAGWGWYVDPTPGDSSEFAAMGSTTEYSAVPDSPAADRIDLLTVLIHELGHVIGLGHEADVHDEMSATVTPGLRRLPLVDANELLAIGFASPITSSTRTSFTRVSPGPSYSVAANPKLSNTEFAGGQGWSTTGDVRFQDGAATLTEAAASQTRLNQVFIVGENDRFLSFTVADTALDDADQAPDDAFEVALLDANTGASLLGGTGLTRNDAFLNLQADGNEHTSQAVTSIRNADGSRTYLVDLAGIPAGTAVNLAFDLIGFGKGAAAASSHLTIRDLRIGVPQTKDDSATLAEDEVTTIAALANDLNAQQPGFAPIIVDAPVHGQITINADGTFSFAPEKDWHGEDHFSYKLSDGHVDSNLAIVSLTVTPVNDAPVAAHDAASVGEDGTIAASGNLLGNDSDVDTGTMLTVAASGDYVGAYGTLTLAQDGSYSYALANASRGGQTLHAGKVVAAPKLSPHNP